MNAKLCFLLFGVLICILGSSARSTHTEKQSLPSVASVPSSGVLIRHKRFTCDVLSGFGVNHSACAVHCIAIGRKGGHCGSNGVCYCRK